MDLHTQSSLPSGRDVLVVEDEVRIRNMLSQALKQMGFSATLAPQPEAAARALAQRSFDILILDLNLPGAGGIEFLESVRKVNQETQVIILTGFGDLDAAQKAIHLDVVDFLTKPCTLGSLEVALDRARKRVRGQIVAEASVSPEPRLQFETSPRIDYSTDPEGDDAAAAETAVSMEEVEERHILSVLHKHRGNRVTSAAELGISLRKLYYRLGEYQKKGIVVPQLEK